MREKARAKKELANDPAEENVTAKWSPMLMQKSADALQALLLTNFEGSDANTSSDSSTGEEDYESTGDENDNEFENMIDPLKPTIKFTEEKHEDEDDEDRNEGPSWQEIVADIYDFPGEAQRIVDMEYMSKAEKKIYREKLAQWEVEDRERLWETAINYQPSLERICCIGFMRKRKFFDWIAKRVVRKHQKKEERFIRRRMDFYSEPDGPGGGPM